MSRVEVSQSLGPHVITSIGPTSTNTTSDPFLTDTWTVHSYQVVVEGVDGDTDLTFNIYATNDSDANYQVIASYAIDNSTNSTGIMYSDIWNFKYAKCEITGSDFGAATITVIEKHNP